MLREKKEIEKWLKKYNIENYELISRGWGYVVNVNGSVNLLIKNKFSSFV